MENRVDVWTEEICRTLEIPDAEMESVVDGIGNLVVPRKLYARKMFFFLPRPSS